MNNMILYEQVSSKISGVFGKAFNRRVNFAYTKGDDYFTLSLQELNAQLVKVGIEDVGDLQKILNLVEKNKDKGKKRKQMKL